jgi:hypothetical protein
MEAAAYGAASDAKLQLTCALDVTVAGFANGWPVERDCRGGERFVSSRQRCVAKIPRGLLASPTPIGIGDLMSFIADSLLRSRILQPIPHKVERPRVANHTSPVLLTRHHCVMFSWRHGWQTPSYTASWTTTYLYKAEPLDVKLARRSYSLLVARAYLVDRPVPSAFKQDGVNKHLQTPRPNASFALMTLPDIHKQEPRKRMSWSPCLEAIYTTKDADKTIFIAPANRPRDWWR